MKTRFITLITGITLSSLAMGCAHNTDRAPTMVSYEQAKEAEEASLIRERSPDLFNAAEVEYTTAIKSERDKEDEAVAHHSQVAVLLWRTAEARSHTLDAEARVATADRRLATAEASLANAKAERDEEMLALARLEKLIQLQEQMDSASKAMATQKQNEKAKAATNTAMLAAMAALKDAEAVQASVFAPAPYLRAQQTLAVATATLKEGDLAGAEKLSVNATASATQAKQIATPKFEADRARRTYEGRLKGLFDAVKATGDTRRVSDRGVTVTLRGVFESGETFVAPISKASLEKLAGLASTYAEFAVIVEAHTDNRGGTTANLTLGKSRSDAVLAYLVEKGVNPSRITSLGKGSSEPIADNRSKDGRAINRRVEITFVQPPAP